MSYIEVTGKTEEEAVRKALTQLGLERDDVSLEILERAKSGFLGIGGSPARIRVTYGTDEPEEKKAEPTKKVEKKPEPKAEVKKAGDEAGGEGPGAEDCDGRDLRRR